MVGALSVALARVEVHDGALVALLDKICPLVPAVVNAKFVPSP
jgi:hypothetical protein